MNLGEKLADLVLHGSEGVAALEDVLRSWAQTAGLQHPQLSALQFELLRRYKPILVVGDLVVVTRFRDVVEVLSRSDAFHAQYMPIMERLAGRGTLGMDDTPEYRADAAVLRRAMKPSDGDRLAESAAALSGELVARHTPARSLDLIPDLFGVVPVRLIAEYFGTPGLDPETQQIWSNILFEAIFGNVRDDVAKLTREQLATAAGWRYYIDSLIADRKRQIAAGADLPDDLMTRLLQMQGSPEGSLSDDRIRANLIYMTVGFLPQISKILTLALDELLNRPAELAALQGAARDDNDALVSAYIFEALRFNAETPGLFRRADSDQPVILAAGTRHQTTLPRGALVLAATQSAMFDEEVLTAPAHFRVDRPWNHYLYFGAGQHRCFGEYLSQSIVPEIVKPLLKQVDLRRAPGHHGELQWAGIWPSHLHVEFA